MVLAFLFAIILTLAHYFSEKINLRYTEDRMKNISFTAGIFITYLFLELFPMLFQADLSFTRMSLLFLVIGFGLFHSIQKYEFKHVSRRRLRKEIKELHSIAFFIYHFVVGIILVNLVQISALRGILFLIAVFSFTIMSGISIKEIHPDIKQKTKNKIFLSLSALFGVVVATLFSITGIVYAALLGLIAGTLLFIVVEESIPREREGEPLYFIYGMLVFAVVVAVTWLL